MENHLVLVSIFLDDENKLKKAAKVKNVKEIQKQAKTMYPVGKAFLERFMVYSSDFKEFIDVDRSHKVQAKEKYQLHFKSLKKTPTASEPGDCSSPAKKPMTKQEFKRASQIFKKNLTRYRRGINRYAHKIALEDPELLQNRARLLKLAQDALTRSGYKYAGKARKFSNIKVIQRDVTSSEHSYSALNVYRADPSEAQQDNDQPESQTPEKSPSEQANEEADDSSLVVTNLEALVDATIQDEGHGLTSTSSSIQGAVTQEYNPQQGLNVESAELAALRKASMIFGRDKKIVFTSYQTKMNEMAFKAALKNPLLLDRRGELYTEAKKRLHYSGYKYTRSNQTRSKLFQPGSINQEKLLTKKERMNRIADIDVKVTVLKEEMALITSDRSKLEWHDRVEQLDKQIDALQDKIAGLESEKHDLIKKGNSSSRKWAWEYEFTEKRQRSSSRRTIAAREGSAFT